MSRFVRESKVRHVYCQPPKVDECYTGMRLSTATGDHNYIKGNSKFFAVACQGGGGPLAIIPYGQMGRYPLEAPKIQGHSSAVLDFDFMPSHDQVIATGSDDCTVKLWGIPSEEGLTENITEPLADMHGHERKVTHVKFHPTASNVLASTSADFLVKIWDVEKGAAQSNITGHTQLVSDMDWSHDGSILATTCKDKHMRLFDARTDKVAAECEPHAGTKTAKICYLGKRGTIITTGFTRQSKRQIVMWDPKNLSEPIKTLDMDQAAGVMMPFFDDSLNILYVAGKGDGNIRYFEIVDAAPFIFPISEHRSSTSTKGCAMLPKKCVDVTKNEVARVLKLTNSGVEPLSFILPRKSDMFQSDIFPDCESGAAALTADEYFGGKNASPPTQSMRPGEEKADDGPKAAPVMMKSAAQLQRELDAANKRIAELEAEVKKLKA
jgi:coronin-1B/1C/6